MDSHFRIFNRSARSVVAWAVLLALPVALSIPFLADPFDNDEAVYGVVSRQLLEGEQPYRDVFDHKPPGIYLWYAVAFLIFGESELGPRVIGALALSGTAAATMLAAGMLWGGRAPWLAGAACGLSCGVAIIRPHANVEPFMLLPMSWALVFGLRARAGRGFASAACAGLLAAVACLMKPVAAGNAAVVLWLCMSGAQWRGAGWWLVGFAAPVCATAGWMTATGTLKDAIYANATYNAMYTAEVSLSTKLWLLQFNGRLVTMAAAPLFLGTALAAAQMLARRRSGDMVAGLWLAASAFGVAATGRFYGHYFIQLFPAMALMVAGGFSPNPRWLWHPIGGRLAVAAGGVAAGLAVFMNAPFYATAEPVERANAREGSETAVRGAVSKEVGEYVAANTMSNEAVLLVGRDTAILWYADRRPASRFVFDMPLWMDDERLEEFIDDIESAEAAVVVDWLDGIPGLDLSDPRVERVRRTVEARYTLAETIDGARVYRRRGP
jgi:4-amino-4-deoxy-L-arabinose transferase-like glycosyltransferase